MRGKTGFLRNIKLTDVKYYLAVRFLMALHGLKCERGKKILKRWGFSGVRAEKSEHFADLNLTCVNVVELFARRLFQSPPAHGLG